MNKSKKGFEKQRKMDDEYSKLMIQCPYCQHKNMMPVYDEKRICYWCGKLIKNNSKAYFIYKIRKINKNK